jgi:hypothetical protein
MRENHRFSVLLLFFSLLTIAFLNFQSAGFAEAKTNSVGLPSMNLTIIGASGTQILHETDIGNMANLTAAGGRIKQAPGGTEGLGNYTGVPINAFCNLVGGLHPGQTLRVTAKDNYTMNFTYAQINGGFPTYNSTRAYVNYSKPLTTILAYYFNGANLTSGGPLRFAIVGSDGLYTNSSYWVKYVVKMEVLGVPIPEFPSLLVLPLFIFVTSVATFGLKACRRRTCAKGFAD